MKNYPKVFLELCHSVKAKRPKTVIDHVLKHGYITTEELKVKYGYDHPPRAARDVREHGIPLETYRVEASNGRKIGAYRFGNVSAVRLKRFEGRTALSKKLKSKLLKEFGCKCSIYLEPMDEGLLQIDHRIPYEIDGDSTSDNQKVEDFMLLCGSANRAKAWSCEHCENSLKHKDRKICLSCYWAYPEDYKHVAMRQIRRIDLIWEGKDTVQHEQLKKDANKLGVTLPNYVKSILSKTDPIE